MHCRFCRHPNGVITRGTRLQRQRLSLPCAAQCTSRVGACWHYDGPILAEEPPREGLASALANLTAVTAQLAENSEDCTKHLSVSNPCNIDTE